MAIDIIAPRMPFIDPRTNTIAREWFLFLLRGRQDIDGIPDSVTVQVANNSFIQHVSQPALYIPQSESILATQIFGG